MAAYRESTLEWGEEGLWISPDQETAEQWTESTFDGPEAEGLTASQVFEALDDLDDDRLFLSDYGRPSHPIAMGLGFSIGIHCTLVVLVVLMGFLQPPLRSEEPTFVMVSLTDRLGDGGGEEGARAGSGGGDEGLSPPGSTPSQPVGNPPLPEEYVPTEPEVTMQMVPSREVPPPCSLVPLEQPAEVPPKIDPPKQAMKPTPRKVPHERPRRSAAVQSASYELPSESAPSEQPATQAPGASFTDASASPNGLGGSGIGLSGAGSGTGTGRGTGAGGKEGGSGIMDLNQVDIPPTAVRKVDPEFPLIAKQMGVGGRVTLKFLVKSDGSVCKASVVEATPQGIFDQCALEAIQRWKFNPGRYRGTAVATWVVQPILFRLAR